MKPFRLILHYSRRYAKELAVTAASMLLLVGAQLLVPQIIRSLIAAVTAAAPGAAAGAQAGAAAGTANAAGAAEGGSLRLVATLTAAAAGLMVGKAVLQFLRSYLSHVAGWGVVADSRRYIYEHMQRLSLRYYEDKQIGQLMSSVVNDTDLFEQFIAHAIPDVLVNAVTFAGVFAVLASIDLRLTLLSLVPIPLVVVSLRLYAKLVRPAFRARQKELGSLNATLNDNLSGIREIKAFAREESAASRVGERIESHRRSNLRALRLMATFQPFVELASSAGTLVVIFFGGRLALSGTLPVADLVAFFLYLEMFYAPIRGLSGAWEAIQSSMAGADRVAGLLSEDEEPHDLRGAREIAGRAAGAISFRGVSFAYAKGPPVLRCIDLDIPAKSVVALVGPTGVGKSTLVSLVPRFRDPTEGSITLDGRDLRELSLTSLRRQIGIVLQDVFLFYGTVRDNILFGREDASEAELVDAAKAANAHDFILRLPEGYDTLIGERGVKLSGGQKQRLSIARAILKDAPVLILDEATSSVDVETEILIQEALDRLMRQRTTIIIAHRLSTVRHADRIVVLEDGGIRESGRHDELARLPEGYYRRLLEAQRAFSPVLPD